MLSITRRSWMRHSLGSTAALLGLGSLPAIATATTGGDGTPTMPDWDRTWQLFAVLTTLRWQHKALDYLDRRLGEGSSGPGAPPLLKQATLDQTIFAVTTSVANLSGRLKVVIDRVDRRV